jgi:hypothetical protein
MELLRSTEAYSEPGGESEMSTAPIINADFHPNWEGQFPELLKRYRNFSTRADAHDALARMASVAELYVADHPATDGFHTNIKELLRVTLQAHLSEDPKAFATLLHIAKLADQYEMKK